LACRRGLGNDRAEPGQSGPSCMAWGPNRTPVNAGMSNEFSYPSTKPRSPAGSSMSICFGSTPKFPGRFSARRQSADEHRRNLHFTPKRGQRGMLRTFRTIWCQHHAQYVASSEHRSGGIVLPRPPDARGHSTSEIRTDDRTAKSAKSDCEGHGPCASKRQRLYTRFRQFHISAADRRDVRRHFRSGGAPDART